MTNAQWSSYLKWAVHESFGSEATASKSKLDELFEKERKAKLGIDKLDYELSVKRTPVMIDDTPTEVKESRYFQEHMQKIKARFGLPNGLEVEGLGQTKQTTLPEHTAERQRQAAQLDKLKVATAKTYTAGQLSIRISI